MVRHGDFRDVYGWTLTLATFRRASWRSREPIRTGLILEYFAEWQGIPDFWGRIDRLAAEYGYLSGVEMVEDLAS